MNGKVNNGARTVHAAWWSERREMYVTWCVIPRDRQSWSLWDLTPDAPVSCKRCLALTGGRLWGEWDSHFPE
jgi:hypothetical protein